MLESAISFNCYFFILCKGPSVLLKVRESVNIDISSVFVGIFQVIVPGNVLFAVAICHLQSVNAFFLFIL